MLYPWQMPAWQALNTLHPRWPHALLIHGQSGIGKTAFARHLAQSLLCESANGSADVTDPSDMAASWAARPCGHCMACKWFEQGNHPDFRAVFPESMGAGTPEGADGEAAATSDAKSSEPAKPKVLSKEIKVEQVRSLLEFCGIGAHRGGRRVVLIYPAEAMNAASSNALLKTLEEPPESVVFVLVTSRIERLLPTIISRCRQWPMGVPAAGPAQAWLAAQGGMDSAQASAALALAGGAPLAAQAGSDDPQHRFILSELAAGGRCDAFGCADALQKTAVPLVFGWLQRWLYDVLSLNLTGAVRYYPLHLAALRRCAGAVDALALTQMNQWLARQRASENHPLNARLLYESLFLRYRDLFIT